MSSFLEVRDGIYDPSKRFAFTNITDDPFESKWGGVPIKVKPHETITLPHHLAVKLTTELVDNIMLGALKTELDKKQEKDPNYRAPSGAGTLGIPAVRKVWEDKILRELQIDEENPEMQVLRIQIKDQLVKDMNQEKAPPVSKMTVSEGEFAQLKKK